MRCLGGWPQKSLDESLFNNKHIILQTPTKQTGGCGIPYIVNTTTLMRQQPGIKLMEQGPLCIIIYSERSWM